MNFLIDSAAYLTRPNLEVVLGKNRRTFDDRVKALIDKGNLIRIKNGLYINKSYLDKESNREAYLEYLSSVIKYPSYISLQYVLAKAGLIAESPFSITCVTPKKPITLNTPIGKYVYRNIRDDLFMGYETEIYKDKPYLMAKLSKALFDLLYLQPFASNNDIKSFIKDSRMNWGVLTNSDKGLFKEFILMSKSVKMRKFLKLI